MKRFAVMVVTVTTAALLSAVVVWWMRIDADLERIGAMDCFHNPLLENKD